ncbi:TPA: AlpA family phage regulatory protein [Burkholderia vietnamiensis]|nr:AlpA family phage regulatory protein [Burkholderia vietnamiensis]
MSDLSNTDSSIQLVDRTTVEKMTSLSKTQIYALMQEGKFPRQINLSARSVAWILAEINQWINDRKRDRDIKYSRTDSQ